MNEFIDMIKGIASYVGAIETGVQKALAAAPIVVKQKIEYLAKQRLQSTRAQYLESLRVGMKEYVLVFDLDPDDWISNASESGAPGWDMKKTHLKSPKAKTSKKGYKYLVIPMEKTKGYKPGTEKGQAYQAKVEETLKNLPTLGVGAKKLQVMVGGKVRETQKINTTDPMMKGFYRTREFESTSAMHKNKSRTKWQYVMFRVMSDNPSQRDKWKHPGIEPANILQSVSLWFDDNFPKMLDNAIEEELKKAGF